MSFPTLRLKTLRIVFMKELTEVLRDRRTLGFMVALPVLVIPALMWVMTKVAESGVKRLEEEASIIAVVGSGEAPGMTRLLGSLGNAAGNPGFFAELGDPLLAQGLMNFLSAEETADVLLAAPALQEKARQEKARQERALSQEDLGGARFLDVVDFEPQTDDAVALFSGGLPDFLRDASRLRLLGSARTLRERQEDGQADDDDTSGRPDPALLADEKRLASMSDAERATVDAELADFEALGREVAAGVKARRFHAVLVFHDGFGEALHGDGTARYSVLYDDAQEKSRMARRKVTAFLDRLSDGVVRARISGHGLERTILDPFTSESLNIGRERSILASLLPYVVILMCLVGAVYPAIDLGAGEKERGTLETLLVTPAHRSELVVGKFLVVTLAALVAAMLNVASLTVSVKLGLFSMAGTSGIVFDPKAALVSVLLMLPVGAVFAAVLLAVSIFAKSFKEAQSYSTPFQFLVIIPAFFSFIPGVELTIPLSFVPLVSVSLALKEAWAGIFQWDCIAVIGLSSALYAAVTLGFCVLWFQREEVLFRT